MFKVCSLSLLLVFGHVMASNETGTISFNQGQYASNQNSAGFTFFYLSATRVGAPSCATLSGGERWVINNDWPGAKLQLSILLAAKMAGKPVTVIGSGDCGVYGDTETAINIFPAD